MKGRDVAVHLPAASAWCPLRSAIQYVLNHREDYGKVTILYGTKSPAERLFPDELDALGRPRAT